MCTFSITNIKDFDNSQLKLGGPTLTNQITLNEITFTHNLLAVTGKVTPQPVKSGGLYFMLLGEIYNYDKSLPSDIWFVIQQYNKYGSRFVDYLDGEYLVVVFDDKMVQFFSDPWSSRQVYYWSEEDKFYYGTLPYKNSVRVIPRKNVDWNFSQHKLDFNDFIQAFEEAVLKRWHKDAILSFSGGIDSSAIAVCLAKHDIKFDAVMMQFNDVEDHKTVNSVAQFCHNKMNLHVVKDRVNIENRSMFQLAQIIKNMRNKKVVIQGNGADEIISNYSNKRINPLPKNYWKENLKSMFPWEHFYDGQMRKVLDYKETAFLQYGLELRNVFLDKKLVQEWFNVHHVLKNSVDKAPLVYYLKKHNIHIPDKIARGSDQDK